MSNLIEDNKDITNMDIEKANDELIHLMDYWRIIYKRLPLILLIIVLITLTGSLLSYNLPKKYTADITIQVTREDKALAIDPFERTYRGDKFWLNTEYEVLTSEPVVEKVIKDLDLINYFSKRKTPSLISNLSQQLHIDLVKIKTFFKKRKVEIKKETKEEKIARIKKAAIKRVQSMISAKPSRDTTLVTLSVTTVEDPKLAANIANKLAGAYEEFKINNKLKVIYDGIDKLNVEYAKQERTVKEHRTKVQKIQQEYKLTTLPGREITRDNDEEISRLKGMLAEARVELNMKQTLYEKLKNMSAIHFEEAIGIIVADKQDYMKLKNELNDSIVEFELLHMDLGENHPKVKRAQKKMDALRKQMSDRMTGIKGGILAQLEEIKSKVKGLEKELSKLQREYSGEYADQITEFNNAVKDLKAEEELLETLRSKIKKETISLKLPRSGVSMLLKTAIAPTEASSPNTTRNILITIFIAMAISVGTVFFLEYLDNSVTKIEELEKMTNQQVLSAIPLMTPTELFSNKDTKHNEVYRQLRTNLIFSIKKGQKVFSVQSSNSGEGKSTTSAKLAGAFAEAGSKVLIIDCDLRRPHLHKTLKCKNEQGVTDYITHKQTDLSALIQETSIPNVFAITSGSISGNIFTMMTSEVITGLLDSVRDSFDYIFVDSPPVMVVNESLIIANCVDSNIMVVQYSKYPKTIINRSVKTLLSSGANVAGFVLNKVNVKSDTYYYHHYYYNKYYTNK